MASKAVTGLNNHPVVACLMILAAIAGICGCGMMAFSFFTGYQSIPSILNTPTIQITLEKPTPVVPQSSSPRELATIQPTATVIGNHAPVLKAVEIGEDWSSGMLVVVLNEHYQDLDGDAAIIQYDMLANNIPYASPEPDLLEPSQRQISGDVFIGRWYCRGAIGYTKLQARVVDSRGNKSAPLEFEIICR